MGRQLSVLPNDYSILITISQEVSLRLHICLLCERSSTPPENCWLLA